ncbi:uncharacterized protein [Lepeophtheirus salmonis]|uniref:uncharacterized protein n=1 Tax=Lepeophtheirus salmonis TaxID=72036 RepID=UPI003AF3C5EB
MDNSKAWVIILPILIGIGSIKVPRHFEYISYIQRSEELFEFMKDFRNYQELNPLITYINITEEGPYHQEAEYEEYYETLPSIFMNRSKGKFLVKPHILIIESTHSTCLIMGEYYCLQSSSIKQIQDRTSELDLSIDYECPLALIPICVVEIEKQQTKILNNIKGMFGTGRRW